MKKVLKREQPVQPRIGYDKGARGPVRSDKSMKTTKEAARPFSSEDIRANRDYFAHKLRAEKQKNDVIKKVKGEPGAGEFLLLDVRSRDAFAKAHIRGAFSAPLEELGALMAQLPKDRELVTYCWDAT